MPSMSLYIADEIYTKIVQVAKKKGKTKGDLIREALREYINKREFKQEKLL